MIVIKVPDQYATQVIEFLGTISEAQVQCGCCLKNFTEYQKPYPITEQLCNECMDDLTEMDGDFS